MPPTLPLTASPTINIPHMSGTFVTVDEPTSTSLPPKVCILEFTLVNTFYCACLIESRLCELMDHSPPGSSVHGLLQARIPEWVANFVSYRFGQMYK